MHNNCGDNCKISSCLNVDVLRNILRERFGKDIFLLFVKNFEKLYFIKYLYKKKLLYIL